MHFASLQRALQALTLLPSLTKASEQHLMRSANDEAPRYATLSSSCYILSRMSNILFITLFPKPLGVYSYFLKHKFNTKTEVWGEVPS
jgi:hypothetical protein